jgi:hypothetical protein
MQARRLYSSRFAHLHACLVPPAGREDDVVAEGVVSDLRGGRGLGAHRVIDGDDEAEGDRRIPHAYLGGPPPTRIL